MINRDHQIAKCCFRHAHKPSVTVTVMLKTISPQSALLSLFWLTPTCFLRTSSMLCCLASTMESNSTRAPKLLTKGQSNTTNEMQNDEKKWKKKKKIIRPKASSLALPHSHFPDALPGCVSWQSYRARAAAIEKRETMKGGKQKRFRAGQMASWLQATDRHRLFRKRLLASSGRLGEGAGSFTRRRSRKLCWYPALPPTCDGQPGSDASFV